MKKLILTFIFSFIGFLSFANEFKKPIKDILVVHSNSTSKSNVLNEKNIGCKDSKIETAQAIPVDFSVMLLSCGKTISWQNTETSGEDIVFWWYIYDWIYC